MSVDYDAVSGIGVYLTEEMINKFVEHEVFTEEEWGEDPSECLDKIDLSYGTYGNYYSGDVSYALFVGGKTLMDIVNNEMMFRARLARYGINIGVAELIFIEETLVS